MDFIHVANTHAILQQLDDAEQRCAIVLLMGEQATGKTRLLEYWNHEYHPHEHSLARIASMPGA